MMSNFLEQAQTSDKNTEIKYPKGDRLLAAGDGALIEFSIVSKTIVRDQDDIKIDQTDYPWRPDEIQAMVKTPDNKTQFISDFDNDFKELDISTFKIVNSFKIKNVGCCVVSHDNKSLITAENLEKCVLRKWSIRTKKLLYTWKSRGYPFRRDLGQDMHTQTCSYDNKYQLIGYEYGGLEIFDLQKYQTLKYINVMNRDFFSVAFSHDNQNVFIGDNYGNIKQINWKADDNYSDDFAFAKNPAEVSSSIYSICLTKDEKYLLIGSKALLRIFETTTKKVTKKIKLTADVIEISLIKDGKYALVAEENGNLSVIDLTTLDIFKIAKIKDYLNIIVVI